MSLRSRFPPLPNRSNSDGISGGDGTAGGSNGGGNSNGNGGQDDSVITPPVTQTPVNQTPDNNNSGGAIQQQPLNPSPSSSSSGELTAAEIFTRQRIILIATFGSLLVVVLIIIACFVPVCVMKRRKKRRQAAAAAAAAAAANAVASTTAQNPSPQMFDASLAIASPTQSAGQSSSARVASYRVELPSELETVMPPAYNQAVEQQSAEGQINSPNSSSTVAASTPHQLNHQQQFKPHIILSIQPDAPLPPFSSAENQSESNQLQSSNISNQQQFTHSSDASANSSATKNNQIQSPKQALILLPIDTPTHTSS